MYQEKRMTCVNGSQPVVKVYLADRAYDQTVYAVELLSSSAKIVEYCICRDMNAVRSVFRNHIEHKKIGVSEQRFYLRSASHQRTARRIQIREIPLHSDSDA